MIRRKKQQISKLTGLFVGVVIFTACSAAPAQSSTPSLETSGEIGSQASQLDDNKKFSQSYASNPGRYMATRSVNSEWAQATTIEGDTMQAVLNNKIAYIESVFEDKQELFIIVEGISEQEIGDFEGVRYIYDTSDLYRKLVHAENLKVLVPESTYSLLADDDSNQYHRYVYALDRKTDVELKISYAVNEGALGFMIVAENGDILFEQETAQQYQQTVSLTLDEGLYGIILLYTMEQEGFSGDIAVEIDTK